MRIFALSDIHVDFEANARWIASLSDADYRDDVLILAGDITDTLSLLAWSLNKLARAFRKVMFVPGNHDLWVIRERERHDSLQKFSAVLDVAESSGASVRPFHAQNVTIVPLFAWYDYSFGEPDEELQESWADYQACRWPEGYHEARLAEHFAALNRKSTSALSVGPGHKVITFSHFVPRIDVMPSYIPASKRFLYPVLGTAGLDRQLRQFNPSVHVYGHSHVNRSVELDGVLYVNNAFGYPNETRIASKQLLCIHEC